MSKAIDMTSMKFGKLTVIEKDHSEVGRVFWRCRCDCGNECVVDAVKLRNEKQTSCGCDTSGDKKNKCSINDIKPGMRFGELTLLEPDDRYTYGPKQWYCYCNCGNVKSIRVSNILSGNSKTCGHRNKNTYDLSGEYGVGYTSNSHKEFYFDKEDFDKIKDYTWHDTQIRHSDFYELRAKVKGTGAYVQMQNVVFGTAPDGYAVDHINRNRMDNRKANLRLLTTQENSCNTGKNTSGVLGVCKRKGKWIAQMTYNQEHKYLGTYDTIEEAEEARRAEELKCYGYYVSDVFYKGEDAS